METSTSNNNANMAAPLLYSNLFNNASLWDPTPVNYEDVLNAMDPTAVPPLTSDELQAQVLGLAGAHPTVLAVVNDASSSYITIIHSPTVLTPILGAAARGIDNQTMYLHGNSQHDIAPFMVADNTIWDTYNKRIWDGSATTLNRLTNPARTHIVPPAPAADPDNHAHTARRAILLPPCLVVPALTQGPSDYHPVDFYNLVLAPAIADPVLAPQVQRVVQWWQCVSTRNGNGGTAQTHLYPLTTVVGPGGAIVWDTAHRKVMRDLAPLGPAAAAAAAGLPAVTAAIDTLHTDMAAQAALRETNEAARADAERLRRERQQTFTERHGPEVAALLHRLTEAPGDDDLPQIHCDMAAYKEKSRDITTLNLALYTRGTVVPAINDVSMPKATPHLITLFCTHNIIALGLDFGVGLNPFSIQCQGHASSKASIALATSQQLLESGDAALSMEAITRLQAKDTRFPPTINEAIDKLWGFSVVQDVYLGTTHPLCVAYAAFLSEVCPQLHMLESVLGHDRPYMFNIVFHVMFHVQQWTSRYLRMKRDSPLGTVILATVYGDALTHMSCFTYDGLPQLPGTWTSLVIEQLPALAPAPPAETPAQASPGRPSGPSQARTATQAVTNT